MRVFLKSYKNVSRDPNSETPGLDIVVLMWGLKTYFYENFMATTPVCTMYP